MKSIIFIIIYLIFFLSMNAQRQNAEDSLKTIINQKKNDTDEVNALIYLSNYQNTLESKISYAKQGLYLARKINYKKGEADCLLILAGYRQVNLIQALQYGLNAIQIYEDLKDNTGIASTDLLIQGIYRNLGDYDNALRYAFSGEKIAEANNITGKLIIIGQRLAPLFLAEIGQTYLLKNKLDSAEIYTKRSLAFDELFNGVSWGFPVYLLASIRTMQGNYKTALKNFRTAIPLSIESGNPWDTLQIFAGMSTLFFKTHQLDSAIYYADIVKRNWSNDSEIKNLLEALKNLELSYKSKGENDSAYKYIEESQTIRDSIFSKEKDRELQNITFNEQLKQQDIASAQEKYKSKVQAYILISGILVLILITGILWRNNRNRLKAYTLLEKQKQETDVQKTKVEHTLEELKNTQAQLIQSEKMASLGELTAGIAHEIQNPLNFVNNFSEVNTELIDELSEEINKGNQDRIKAIVKDIKENEEKINHHGRRADTIVKGMLQHSRITSSQKEPTDINKLADEYLRLAYHGLRAKDKSFNATLKTDFDKSIGTIDIIPQDIGRVLLNLFNNAFYALNEKNKQHTENYVPTVSVSTKKMGDKVLISINDNGIGIPKKVVDKIFQPFFTTKPPGQGTGLGLSLSYDIVKVHGGELRVETKESEGSMFIILLPVIE